LSADEITGLARRAASRRALVTCSQSLQRAEHGEQPIWMGVVLAALLGQIGSPGGGFAYALGSTSNTGKPPLAVPLPTLPLGQNSISDFIPVARIADSCCIPARRTNTTASASITSTSSLSIGPAAIRFTTIRI
jgi:biotin/methionine sulfoxide reductase